MSASTATVTSVATTATVEIVNGFPIPVFSDKPQQNKNEKVCPPAPRKPRHASLPNLNTIRPRALSFD